MIREKEPSGISGLAALLALLGLLPVVGRGLIGAARAASIGGVLGWLAALGVVVIAFAGLFVVNPNEGRVLQLFGDYRGIVSTAGLRWANSFYSKHRISQRNFESAHLKVNDADGNPVEIAAVVVWRVVDTAEACFEVNEFENYVKVQSEAAVRNLATRYPYDAHEEHKVSPARRSWRERWGWWTWPRSAFPRASASSWTRNARRPWSATYWSCSAVTGRSSPS